METIIDSQMLQDLSDLVMMVKETKLSLKFKMPLVVVREHGCVAVFDSDNVLVSAMWESEWDKLVEVAGG